MISHTIKTLTAFITLSYMTHAAEVVELSNGNLFSGNISKSDTPSVVFIKHPFAESTIKLKESSIKQIRFQNNSKTSQHSELIQLINGDLLPCSITNIDQENIEFNSSIAGNHIIARDQVSKITFNTKANKLIYKGPGDDLSAWTTADEGWELNKGVLSISKRSEASIQIPDLTKNYILKFSTKRNRLPPKFRFCFSASNNLADRKSDHYYLDFNTHGISLQRSKNGQYDPLAQILSHHDVFNDDIINVEIYVDRKQQKLALYLNDELIKIIAENKYEAAPEGDFVVIKNLQSAGYLTQVSNINIYEWNGKINEDREKSTDALKKHDLITDLNGSIITGDILNISENKSSELTFKAPFAKNDSAIPKSSIDVLEFKQSQKIQEEFTTTNFILNLTNEGKLHYINSQFLDSEIKIEHPILGAISIPQDSIESLSAIIRPIKDE